MEWKLFDGQVPEQCDYLISRPWMDLEGQPGFDQRAQLVVDLVRHVGPVQSISDLGCGDGALLARLAEALVPAVIPMWGYELGAGDIAHGQSRGLDVRFGDVVAGEGLEYGELIIASEVVEHIADPESFLRNLPGRLLIVSSPSCETGDWHNDIHAWAWDLDGYEAMVLRSGWTPVRHVSCDGGVNTFAGVTRQQRFQAILAVRLAVSGSMSNALVTGAAGFVGRHFTRHLRDQGWTVDAIDTQPAEGVARFDARQFFGGSVATPCYDLVVHAAAVVGGRQVIENDPMAQAVNFELDAALFRWALRTQPGRVIYFSSSAAYPVNLQTAGLARRLEETDINLDAPCGPPDSLYGWSKRTGEFLARQAAGYGLAVSVVRPFSGYGSDQGEDYPFGAFTGRALRREDPFLIWGNGSQVRDFIHIDDIVAICMDMYQRGINGPVNLATGRPTSMRQLAQLVCEKAGYAPDLEYVPAAPSGVEYRVGSVTNVYGIRRAKVTLEQGIERALADQARRMSRA